MKEPVLVAVSSCLLGNNVRFNGANSHKKLVTEELSQLFKYHAICPEVAAGMGIPRKPIYLEKNNEKIIIKQHETNFDWTDKLNEASCELIKKLPKIYGFILKKTSPTCGQETVKLYNEKHGVIHHKADGVFVTELKKALPLLAIEDEGRLNDPSLKEHFIKRVLLTYEAEQILLKIKTAKELVNFHTRHKILLRLHHPINQKALGRLVAQANQDNLEQIKSQYHNLFLSSFKKVAKRGNHHTILQRLLREVNKLITKSERNDLQNKIKNYYQGVLPLVVPVEMIKHYLIRYDIGFLKQQSYLNLYPDSLGLMNKI